MPLVMAFMGMFPVVMVVMLLTFMLVMLLTLMLVMLFTLMLVMVVMVGMLLVVVMGMDLAVEMLGLSPDERRSHSGLNGQTAAIAKAPLEDASEQSIDGVVLGAVLQVGVEATVSFDRDQRCEIEFTGFESVLTASAMGPVGQSRRSRKQREQQQGQQQGTGAEHETLGGGKKTRTRRYRSTREWRTSAERVSRQRPDHSDRPGRSRSCRCSTSLLRQRFAPRPRPLHREVSWRSAIRCCG